MLQKEKNIQGADVLIGMDVINCGDFAISNLDGKTSFSFRMPSLERIDFAEAIEREASNASAKKSNSARQERNRKKREKRKKKKN